MTATFARFDPLYERAAWLAWRRKGVGASDVAAICGLSRWGSPMSVYLDKLGLLNDSDQATESMRWGTLLERTIAEEFATRTGLTLMELQPCVTDTEHPWRRASLDALVGDTVLIGEHPTTNLDDALGILETKNTSDFGWDDVPDEYAIQCQWQLGVAGLEQGWLAALHGGRRLAIYEVPASTATYARLCTIVERFWHEHVLAKNPPPTDSSPATTDALKDAYRDLASGEVLDVDDDVLKVALKWQHSKLELARWQAVVDGLENELRATLGEAVAASYEGTQLVTWKPQRTRAPFDMDGLRRDFPDIAEKLTGDPGTARALRATKALKERVGTR